MAVVATGELHDHVAAGEAARQPDRRHGGLGARRDEPHPLDRRPRHDLLGQVDLGHGRGAVRRAAGHGRLHRRLHLRVGVADQHRTPGADQVDVLVAVDVGEPRSRADRMKRGVPPTASNARTGEFTPPGITARARSNIAREAARPASASARVWSPAIVAEPPEGPRPGPGRSTRTALTRYLACVSTSLAPRRARGGTCPRQGSDSSACRFAGEPELTGDEMSAQAFGRWQKASAIVPLALLSAAWTASLAGTGAATAVFAESRRRARCPMARRSPVRRSRLRPACPPETVSASASRATPSRSSPAPPPTASPPPRWPPTSAPRPSSTPPTSPAT